MNIHFLDVGLEKYGDCILIEKDGRFILIDGAHHGDGANRGLGRPSIPEQLEGFMGAPPFKPDLLVITHVHGDHVGCLPGMVNAGLLEPQRVLASDPWLGSGRTSGADSSDDRMIEALLEEGPIDSIDEAERLLDWSPEKSYQTMIDSFDPETVWIHGTHATEDLEQEFADFELRVLGPTLAHLELCADLIASEKAKAARDLYELLEREQDNRASDAELLLRLASSFRPAADNLADRQGQGSAKNDQSIVLTVGNAHHRVLLSGDMQFGIPEVPGLAPLMEQLLADVAAAGPYTVVKTGHHTSHNGTDIDVLEQLGGKPLLVHTGGLNDPSHPAPSVLENLRSYEQLGDFYRTDRNGCVSLDLSAEGAVVAIDRGRKNDFTLNPTPPRRRPTGRRDDEAGPLAPRGTPKALGLASDFVEVITRIPNKATTVTITIRVQPDASPPDVRQKILFQPAEKPVERTPERQADILIAGGRTLPKLLVVTASAELGRQIERPLCDQILKSLRMEGLTILDLEGVEPDPEPLIAKVHEKLKQGRYEGLLILGGYSVIPSVRISAIDDELRAEATSEMDNYIVWSDDPYVTLDDDGIPDYPVSRIPSLLGLSNLVVKCLQAGGRKGTRSFGIRNQARPFADGVFQLISTGICHPSIPTIPGVYPNTDVDADHLYFMLHGHYAQGDAFTGEDGAGGYPVAISTAEIPSTISGVAFAGCCYGALLTDNPAMYAKPGKFPKERNLDESMALTLLGAGAHAFIGCTGIHYSPQHFPNSMGEPMHRYFWGNLLGGQAPAVALFNAKLEYLKGVPHTGKEDATDVALELKIFSQFTCLGIGW